jgi:hypothetical protein
MLFAAASGAGAVTARMHASRILRACARRLCGCAVCRWYTVLGSLQDWLYHSLRVVHTTLELHYT